MLQVHLAIEPTRAILTTINIIKKRTIFFSIVSSFSVGISYAKTKIKVKGRNSKLK